MSEGRRAFFACITIFWFKHFVGGQRLCANVLWQLFVGKLVDGLAIPL